MTEEGVVGLGVNALYIVWRKKAPSDDRVLSSSSSVHAESEVKASNCSCKQFDGMLVTIFVQLVFQFDMDERCFAGQKSRSKMQIFMLSWEMCATAARGGRLIKQAVDILQWVICSVGGVLYGNANKHTTCIRQENEIYA